MNRAKAIEAAGRAADAVWSTGRGKGDPAHLIGRMEGATYRSLGEWVEANPTAPAEALYIQHTRAGRTAWSELAPVLRVAIEVFRATYLILLVEVRAAEAAARERVAPPAPELPDRGIFRANEDFREQPGFGTPSGDYSNTKD